MRNVVLDGAADARTTACPPARPMPAFPMPARPMPACPMPARPPDAALPHPGSSARTYFVA